jgi:hypothetical protein
VRNNRLDDGIICDAKCLYWIVSFDVTRPVSPSIVVSGGLTIALLSYVVLSVIRSSFEDYPLEV